MKKLLLSLLIASLMVASSFGQGLVRLEPTKGYSQTRALTSDSADFYSSFVFNIPEGCAVDTVHLLLYATSTAADLDVTSIFGFKKAGRRGRDIANYAWQADSTTVVTAMVTVDEIMAYSIYPVAGDTTAEGTQIWHDAVRINVKGGGTANRIDTDFWLKLTGQKDNDK